MKFVVRIEGWERTVLITRNTDHYDVEIDGRPLRVDCVHFGDKDYLSLLIDNESYLIESAPVKPDEGRYYALVMGRHYDVDVLDELLVAVREAEQATEQSDGYTVVSPMPGMVVDVKVSVGDEVAIGDPVAVVEAMKMQNELTTEVAGVVKEVRVTSGQPVESHAPMVVIGRK